eukprot:14325060-Alexandrium_andersonii.AAC.2
MPAYDLYRRRPACAAAKSGSMPESKRSLRDSNLRIWGVRVRIRRTCGLGEVLVASALRAGGIHHVCVH